MLSQTKSESDNFHGKVGRYKFREPAISLNYFHLQTCFWFASIWRTIWIILVLNNQLLWCYTSVHPIFHSKICYFSGFECASCLLLWLLFTIIVERLGLPSRAGRRLRDSVFLSGGYQAGSAKRPWVVHATTENAYLSARTVVVHRIEKQNLNLPLGKRREIWRIWLIFNKGALTMGYKEQAAPDTCSYGCKKLSREVGISGWARGRRKLTEDGVKRHYKLVADCSCGFSHCFLSVSQ